ncbi:uncharacterized protein METZ01_LOCUS247341 [marine metagenome]|uniref:Uncharacterized protein n=1 Tax=marine metagenome TaxID=408172 RepID=A0A382I5K7_9ZZZZ
MTEEVSETINSADFNNGAIESFSIIFKFLPSISRY